MYLIAVGWMYVVMLMAVAEATAIDGSVLGAVITFVLYGVVPLSIVLYLVATPRRRAAKRRAQAAAVATERSAAQLDASSPGSTNPHGGSHAAGDAVASKREEA